MSFEKWKTVMLSDICSDINYGYTQSATSEPIGPKFLRITDIIGTSINWESVPYCPTSDSDRQKYKLEIGDIVIARTGASTGATATIKEKVDSVFASYLIRCKINKEYADPFFIGFILKSKVWQKYVQSIIGGSAQPGANAKQFGSFEFPLPPLPTQRRIAAILTALDDKIELNRRMNETLEGIAQALWGEWFGKYASGEVELPEEWKWGTLDDIIVAKGGSTPSTKESAFWDGDISWTSPKDLSNLRFPVLLETEKKISEKGLKQISSGLLPKGTLLLSSRAPIGYLAITQIPVAINQGYIAIDAINGFSNLYILFWLKANMEKVVERANGSTFLEISKANFREIPVLIPSSGSHSDFLEVITPIFQKIVENEKQSKTLLTVRDTLLPKLMQNELDF